jgi:hypothetical protein
MAGILVRWQYGRTGTSTHSRRRRISRVASFERPRRPAEPFTRNRRASPTLHQPLHIVALTKTTLR